MLNNSRHQLQGVGLAVEPQLHHSSSWNVGGCQCGAVEFSDGFRHSVCLEEDGQCACRACRNGLRQVDEQNRVPRYHALTNAWLAKVNTTLSVFTFTPVVDMAAEPRLLTNVNARKVIAPSFLCPKGSAVQSVQAHLRCHTVRDCGCL